jgi:formylglycine-generating enzyme required for sulfatase activity
MGAAPGDAIATDAERPTRMIGFGAPFAISRTEVTVGQYAAFLEATGHAPPPCPEAKHGIDPDLPVTCTSWRDAEAYAAWLARRTHKPFRLPSEAEWEYVARAGAAGLFAGGEQLARSAANIARADGLSVPVGSYPPNSFGVYDMHGNAAELVEGCWTASPAALPGDGRASSPGLGCSQRVLRDAHAGEAATMTRLSARRPIDPDARLPGVGFRVARDLK